MLITKIKLVYVLQCHKQFLPYLVVVVVVVVMVMMMMIMVMMLALMLITVIMIVMVVVMMMIIDDNHNTLYASGKLSHLLHRNCNRYRQILSPPSHGSQQNA